jgi:hypothetical protein
MHQSFFGFHNRDAQMRATAATTKAAQPVASPQSCDKTPDSQPPPYSNLPSEQRDATTRISGTKTPLLSEDSAHSS